MKLCECGCGEPAVYAARHVSVVIRRAITEADYKVMDCGHESPCWIWKGRRAKRYANVRVQGRQLSVHRAMWEQEIGPIPAGRVLDHLCEETRCIRPSHLQPSTVGENVRRTCGFNPSPEDLEEICSGRVVARELAAKHGVSERTIYMVRHRQREKRRHDPTPHSAEHRSISTAA